MTNPMTNMAMTKGQARGRPLLPLLALVTLAGVLASAGCQGKEEATGPGGTKLPEYMSQSERVNAIKSNTKYSDAEKQQAIKAVEEQARLSRGEGGGTPPGYRP